MGSVSSQYPSAPSKQESSTVRVIGSVCFHSDTVFKEAVFQSNLPVVKECVQLGTDINIELEDGNTALHIAAEKCDLPVLKALLGASHIEINRKNKQGLTPLMKGCIVNCREVCQILLKKHADPNVTTDDGNRAIHFACSKQNMGIVFDLVQNGAIINVRNVFDITPLAISVIDYPSMPIAKFMMRKGAYKHGIKEFPLLLECALCCNTLKRLEIFKILVARGMDIHQLHPLERRNCLHYVAITSYLPLVHYLLKFNVDDDLNAADASGRTPLGIALSHQNYAVYELFRLYISWRLQILLQRNHKSENEFTSTLNE